MPAKKSVQTHKLQGTYRPCRHGDREAKANSKQKRSVPVWLPDEVKPIYRKLMVCLPPLDAIEETMLAQVAILKHQFEQKPNDFNASQHSQLRHLTSMVRDWAKDYRDSQQSEEKDDFQAWSDNVKKRHEQNNRYKIPDSPCIRRS